MKLRYMLLSALGLIAFNLSAHGGEPSPSSKKTPWRIPSNPAVTAVGNEVDWDLVKHKNGLVMLEAAIGEHHSYEQAWSYYTNLLGMDSNYNTRTKQQNRIVDGDQRNVVEHDRDHIFKAGRWATMHGNVGKFRMQLSLFNEQGKPKLKDRVSVDIIFHPNR
jgi:hypothetical protein